VQRSRSTAASGSPQGPHVPPDMARDRGPGARILPPVHARAGADPALHERRRRAGRGSSAGTAYAVRPRLAIKSKVQAARTQCREIATGQGQVHLKVPAHLTRWQVIPDLALDPSSWSRPRRSRPCTARTAAAGWSRIAAPTAGVCILTQSRSRKDTVQRRRVTAAPGSSQGPRVPPGCK